MSLNTGGKISYAAANAVNIKNGDNFITGLRKGISIYYSDKHSNARETGIASKVQALDDELFAKYHSNP